MMFERFTDNKSMLRISRWPELLLLGWNAAECTGTLHSLAEKRHRMTSSPVADSLLHVVIVGTARAFGGFFFQAIEDRD